VTAQVADRATGLGKNLKFTRGFDHCSIPNLQVGPHKALDLIGTRFFERIIVK